MTVVPIHNGPRSFPEMCVNAAGSPLGGLDLAIRITRWRMIANLEIWPEPREVIPFHVARARDRELRKAAA